MLRKFIGLTIVLTAFGCASRSGPEAVAPTSGSEMGPEAVVDRGMSGRDAEAEALTARFQTIYFEFDKSSLLPEARGSLQQNGDLIKQNPGFNVEIQGHCDERGSNEYNMALGQRRAESARQYLIDLGIDGSRLTTVSYGEENPAVQGHNEVAWSKNRRAEFVASR